MKEAEAGGGKEEDGEEAEGEPLGEREQNKDEEEREEGERAGMESGSQVEEGEEEEGEKKGKGGGEKKRRGRRKWRSPGGRKGRSLGGRRGGVLVGEGETAGSPYGFHFVFLSPLWRTDAKLCYNSNFTTVHTETLKFSFNPVGECGAVGRSRWSGNGKWVQGEF